MRIYFESPERLKIELDETDMRDLNVTFDELDYSSEKTRQVMNELLTRIGAEQEFDLKSGRMIIEVFPAEKGGCTIYFTSVSRSFAKPRNRGKKCRASVWEIRSADDLLSAVDSLKQAGISRQISLFELGGRYRLSATLESGWEELLLSEFADRLGDGRALLYTSEHGHLLSNDLLAEM